MNGPSRLNVHLAAAEELERQGDFEAALSQYEQAQDVDNASWPARARHLQLLYQLNRLGDAKQVVSDFLDDCEEPLGAAFNDLGVIEAEQGEHHQAMKRFVRSLRSALPASSSVALGNLAYVLYAADSKKECADVCESALRLDPDETRAHFILSLIESARLYDARRRKGSELVHEGEGVEVFALLRFDGQPMATHRAKVVAEGGLCVYLANRVALSRPGTGWGILVRREDELWCGFSQQVGESTAAAGPIMHLPEDFYLVQRRRWVRTFATGGLARLTVRSFPRGVVPVEVEKFDELNLSAGGAAVRTVPKLPRGTVVSLFLKLDDEPEIEVLARVTRIGQPEAADPYSALTFSNLEERQRDQIARFVNNVQLSRKRGTAPIHES